MRFLRNSHNALITCTICLQAKQTRGSFLLSDSMATSSFDLVHYDVWGSYREKASCRCSYFLTLVDDLDSHEIVHSCDVILRRIFFLTPVLSLKVKILHIKVF